MKRKITTLQLDTENSKTVAHVSLETDITMKHAAYILQELLEAEKKCDVLYVKSKIGSLVDLSGFQVLMALSIEINKKNKRLHLDLNLSEESQQLFHKAGLDNLLHHTNN